MKPQPKSVFGFSPGDQFVWHDPDDGSCTRSGTIKSIHKLGGKDVAVTATDGWYCEMPIRELEHQQPQSALDSFLDRADMKQD